MQSFLIKTDSLFLEQLIDEPVISKIIDTVNLTAAAPKLADIQIINPDRTSIKIEQIRHLITELSYKTRAASPRVFIFWQAELMTIPAQNALLKSLEEPPTNTYLILVTDQPETLLATIRSRCQLVTISSPPSNSRPEDNESYQLLLKLLDQKVSYSELIEIAGKHGDRDQALNLTRQLMETIHNQSDYPNPSSIKNLKILLQAQADFKANVNVKLTLEECFFQIKATK